MRIALTEASKGLGRTSPNPAVGAVLVKNGRVVARGHHAKAGGPHAEIVALRRAGPKARGADLYTTLEPCDHHGKTPPCTQAIREAGIRRVIVGCLDQNPIVSGRGVRRLRAAGIPVLTGVLKEECAELNRAFFTWVSKRRPFVTLKIASTADGKIATVTGDSKWITGEKARAQAHRIRAQVDAIVVGAGTVRADDPRLTARPRGREAARQPVRVIISGSLDIPPASKIFDPPGQVLVITSSRNVARARKLESRGAEIVHVDGSGGEVDLRQALEVLGARGLLHVLIEGGSGLYGSLLELGLVDEVLLYLAPRILGEGLGWAKLHPRARIADALALENVSVERLGDDVLLRGRPIRADS